MRHIFATLAAITITITCCTTPAMARPLSAAERLAVEKALKDQLTDPDSARFKHPDVNFPVGIVSAVYCGRVNSKNRMGGYTGDVIFMAAFTRVKIKPVEYEADVIGIGNSDPESTENQSILDICKEKAPAILVNKIVK